MHVYVSVDVGTRNLALVVFLYDKERKKIYLVLSSHLDVTQQKEALSPPKPNAKQKVAAPKPKKKKRLTHEQLEDSMFDTLMVWITETLKPALQPWMDLSPLEKLSLVVEQQMKSSFATMASLIRCLFKLAVPHILQIPIVSTQYLAAKFKNQVLSKYAPAWLRHSLTLGDGHVCSSKEFEGQAGHAANKKVAIYHVRCILQHTHFQPTFFKQITPKSSQVATQFLASHTTPDLDHTADALLQGLWMILTTEKLTSLSLATPPLCTSKVEEEEEEEEEDLPRVMKKSRLSIVLDE